MTGIQSIIKGAHSAGVPRSTMDPAHLRASQINGCTPSSTAERSAPRRRTNAERLFAVAA
jgi:alkylhydroperoxidase family enzyme